MRFFVIKPASRVQGKVILPGDKSIASRLLIISALSQGKTIIDNFPAGQDCLATLSILRALTIPITLNLKANKAVVCGRLLRGFKKPDGPVFVSDSGTTLRLMLGVLAGQDFTTRLVAGRSLSRRPMRRVTEPLRMMGAAIKAKVKKKKAKTEEYPPIIIKGTNLKAITYKMPVASAQVKSAILLAGLYAKGVTQIIEPVKTRDHTERMLRLFGADLKIKQNKIFIREAKELVSPGRIYIPGDISSAGFFMVLAAILPGSQITLKNIGLNPTRSGVIRVLLRMGADIRIKEASAGGCGFEPMGDIVIKSSRLKSTTVKEDEIPSLIDELPILMVVSCYAAGKTVFEGVGELRVKETDRINSLVTNLRKMGAKLNIVKAAGSENIVIEGVAQLKGAKVRSFGDHRTAMSMVVAGMCAQGASAIDDVDCISKSFPGFLSTLKQLIP